MRFFLLISFLSASLASAEPPKPTHAPPIWHSPKPAFEYHDLSSNYWDLYPRGDAVMIETIYPLEDAPGYNLVLTSDDPEIQTFVYTMNGGAEVKTKSGVIRVEFEDNNTMEDFANERQEFVIFGVKKDGSRSKGYNLATMFFPKENYLSRGRIKDGHSRIQIRETDLNFARSRLEDWVLEQPDEADMAFAHKTWGDLFTEDMDDYAAARTLANSLVTELNPHRGTPSNTLDSLGPFDQYRRLMAGEDKCWCANMAMVFSHANNVFGTPTRFILMRHQLFPGPPTGEEGVEILLAGGHTTNEIFSHDHRRWIWMDMSFNIWGAYLGEEGPLNMMEVHRAVNSPERFERLFADIFDPETQTMERVRIADHPIQIKMRNVFKQDQLFRYMRHPEASSPAFTELSSLYR